MQSLKAHSFALFLYRSVKIIRLIGRDTVEEIVCRKAASKLQLTNAVIEGGHFTLGAQKPAADADLQVSYVVFPLRMCHIVSTFLWVRK